MSFSNRKKNSKNLNSQLEKLKHDYFKCNQSYEKIYESDNFKTERYK